MCNLSGRRLKTKKSNIPECWRRFKAETRLWWNGIVWVAQWIKKTIPEFLQITIALNSGYIKMSFSKCTKTRSFICFTYIANFIWKCTIFDDQWVSCNESNCEFKWLFISTLHVCSCIAIATSSTWQWWSVFRLLAIPLLGQ